MSKPTIVLVDDQRDVLTTVLKDLEEFNEYFAFESCESAEEAFEVLEEIDAAGGAPALIVCDHIMPEKNGVELLVELNNDRRFRDTRKLLLTGLATHQDTIIAINAARIDQFIEKPWEKDQLVNTVKRLVTEYLLEKGIDYKPFLPILDQEALYRKLRMET
ncbi:MAG: response regulator [Candidatus Hinthialibacter antarcticus]|nr:response regulator [Candidatus Hinthialibacter antarcticus]